MSLTNLSIRAHERAMAHGTPTPAERYEFSHLPMKRVDGIPVFDGTRMRPDQIVETEERLETICGRREPGTLRDSVAQFLADAGRFGVRVTDVCAETGASKPIVLKYLRELVDGGKVNVKEETTRGAGSKRKRYFWVPTEIAADWMATAELADGLTVRGTDSWAATNANQGIRHGVGVDALSCPCTRCRETVEDILEAEERSAARRRGETGLRVGLELRRVRRERQFAADRALAVAHGLAAH